MMLVFQKFVSLIMSLLTLLSSGALFGDAGRYSRFTDKVGFAPLTAQELRLTEAERAKGREWYETNVLRAGANGVAPAYDFPWTASGWPAALTAGRLPPGRRAKKARSAGEEKPRSSP